MSDNTSKSSFFKSRSCYHSPRGIFAVSALCLFLAMVGCDFTSSSGSGIDKFELGADTIWLDGGTKELGIKTEIAVDSPITAIEISITDSNGTLVEEEQIQVLMDNDFKGSKVVEAEEGLALKVSSTTPVGMYFVRIKVITSLGTESEKASFYIASGANSVPEIYITNFSLSSDTVNLNGGEVGIGFKGLITTTTEFNSIRFVVVDTGKNENLTGVSQPKIDIDDSNRKEVDLATDGIKLTFPPFTQNGSYVVQLQVEVDSLYVRRELPIVVLGGSDVSDINILNLAFVDSLFQVPTSGNKEYEILGSVVSTHKIDTLFASLGYPSSVTDSSKVSITMTAPGSDDSTWDLKDQAKIKLIVSNGAETGAYSLTVTSRSGAKSASKTLNFQLK